MPEYTVALAGNPNVGKSTIFNALTGSRQHVGNWPGKTVEKKEGNFSFDGFKLKVVDLPGTYSLTPFSMEEIIARDYIVEEHPDMVVVVLDAANLERNLYLVVQVLETRTPVVVALNMNDVAQSRGLKIDASRLAVKLNAPVVPTVASTGEGIEELKRTIANVAAVIAPHRSDATGEK
jgi:ferrous iron transport protein B